MKTMPISETESAYKPIIYGQQTPIGSGQKEPSITAGHTPTILEEEFPYNDGEVYSFYDEEQNCKFYDIDCGVVYGHSKSNFAAIRLEDEKLFHLKS